MSITVRTSKIFFWEKFFYSLGDARAIKQAYHDLFASSYCNLSFLLLFDFFINISMHDLILYLFISSILISILFDESIIFIYCNNILIFIKILNFIIQYFS